MQAPGIPENEEQRLKSLYMIPVTMSVLNA